MIPPGRGSAIMRPRMSIHFEIFRDGRRVETYAPVAAYAVGPEGVPMAGRVAFEQGLLRLDATAHAAGAAGVALLWDAGRAGAFVLETTRLPPRDAPYNLNVELARHRLMRLVQKQEDWYLFDFPSAEPLNERLKAAQATFADALGQLDDGPAAAALADAALAEGLALGDEYAHFHADLLLNRRRHQGMLPRTLYGVRADPSVGNQKYRQTLADSFDFAVLPMGWKLLQPEEDVYKTEALDECVELLAKKRLPVIAGPLIELTEGRVPEWMFIWEHDFETLRDLAFEYVRKVVTRYRRAVSMWNVVGGIHTENAFGLSFEQMIELTRLLVAQVKQIVPGARTMVTVEQPYGEYHARHGAGVPPMLYAELVAQSGVNFEAFGLELETGVPTTGRYARDLLQVSCMLDKFQLTGKPVLLTSIGAPGQAGPDADDASGGKLDPSKAGRWGGPWSPQRQAAWLEAVYKIALSKPFVESLTWANLSDISPTLPAGGLTDDSLEPKPAFEAVQKLREARRGKKHA